MFRTVHDLKVVSKHASMIKTQVEQVLKAQNDLLSDMNNKMNDHVVRVMTRGGKMTQEPLYHEGHPKRIEKKSQRINNDAPSPSSNKKKKNDNRTLHASSEPIVDTLDNPMIFLSLMLKHNMVINMNLVTMIMMMFMLMLNLAITTM